MALPRMRRSEWGSFLSGSKGQVLNMKDRSFPQLTPENARWRQCYRDHNSKGITHCQQKLRHWLSALSVTAWGGATYELRYDCPPAIIEFLDSLRAAPLPEGEPMVRCNGGSKRPPYSRVI